MFSQRVNNICYFNLNICCKTSQREADLQGFQSPTKDMALCYIFTKIIRSQFFECKASQNIGKCNYSLLFYVIFWDLFDFDSFILFRIVCKNKIKTKIKRKMCSFHNDGKKFQQKKIKNSCM